MVAADLGEGVRPWRYRVFRVSGVTHNFDEPMSWDEMGLAPCYGVSTTERIGSVEDVTATVPVDAPCPDLVPGRTVIAAERGTDLFAWLLWRIDWASDAPHRQMSLKGWASALQARNVMETLDWRGDQALDQLEMARRLVLHAQDRPGGDLHIDVGDAQSGIVRERVYEGNARKQIWEALTQLAGVVRGFEHRLVPYWTDDDGPIRWRYEQGFPTLGRTASETGYVLDYQEGFPGSNVFAYTWPDDAAGMANVTHVLGEEVVGFREAPEDWREFLRLERSWTQNSVSQQQTIDDYAEAYLNIWHRPLAETQVTLSPNQDTIPNPGDHVRLRLTSRRHPRNGENPGLDEVWRVMERQISAPSRGEPERVRLSLQRPLTVEIPDWD